MVSPRSRVAAVAPGRCSAGRWAGGPPSLHLDEGKRGREPRCLLEAALPRQQQDWTSILEAGRDLSPEQQLNNRDWEEDPDPGRGLSPELAGVVDRLPRWANNKLEPGLDLNRSQRRWR